MVVISTDFWYTTPNLEHSHCAHWTFRPYPPIVKNKKYPPVLAPKSKLHPYIFTILMDGGPNFEIKTKNYQKSELFIWILD